MNISARQIIVTIHTSEQSKDGNPFTLGQAAQLDTIQNTYDPTKVSAVDVEIIVDRQSIKGNTHRSITKKHFDGLEAFIDFAKRRYV